MSNLIKASQIAYSEDIRNIDMNARAEEIQEKMMDKYLEEINSNRKVDFQELSQKLSEGNVLTSEDVGFEPGIPTEQVYLSEDPEQTEVPASREEAGIMEVESRLREKKKELEETEARIAETEQKISQMLDDANAQANVIIEDAEQKAEERINEALEQARAEGLEQGRQQAEEENAQARAELEQIKNQYREEYEKQVDELEPAFVEIVIKYIQKLTGIYADDKKEIILHLIDNALKDKHGNENFIVRVSEADFPVVSYSKDAIRGYLSEGAQLEVVADKLLERNQCMIETESRIYDCSLDGQLMSLIEDIRLLAEKE